MSEPLNVVCIVVGASLCMSLPLIGIASQTLPQGEGPFLVLASPTGRDAIDVIKLAGGSIVGPSSTAFAAISADVPAAELKLAGAFSVLAVASLPFLCSTETTE